MNVIKKIKIACKQYSLKQKAKNRLGDVILTPYGYIQKLREIECIIYGHNWTSTFMPKEELQKPIKDRVYCKRCGVYYHDHKYHEIDHTILDQ